MITDPDGNIIKQTEVLGTQMRASNGNVAIIHSRRNGDPRPTGTFREAATGKVFNVSYLDRRAILSGQGPPRRPNKEQKTTPVGARVIQGIPCVGFPLKDGGSAEVVGTVWVSIANDIEIVMEMNRTQANGNRILWLTELSGIQLGVEPPKGQVGIPETFEILDRARAVSCQSCPRR